MTFSSFKTSTVLREKDYESLFSYLYSGLLFNSSTPTDSYLSPVSPPEATLEFSYPIWDIREEGTASAFHFSGFRKHLSGGISNFHPTRRELICVSFDSTPNHFVYAEIARHPSDGKDGIRLASMGIAKTTLFEYFRRINSDEILGILQTPGGGRRGFLTTYQTVIPIYSFFFEAINPKDFNQDSLWDSVPLKTFLGRSST